MSGIEMKNLSVTMKMTDRKAISALAMAAQANSDALKANADAIKAIAEMGRHHGPSYGIYVTTRDDDNKTLVGKAPEKNPVARNSPVTETQKATVPKPKTSATAKPKEAAPANKPTKTKEEFSLFSTMNETLSKIGGYFEGEKTKKTDASKGNTVVAPITVNKNTNVAGTGAYMTMSMAKTSVRTGM